MFMQRKNYIFFVHIDRENIQETPDFYACMEMHITYAHGIHTKHISMPDDMHMETYKRTVSI